jgi:hypothetical protein
MEGLKIGHPSEPMGLRDPLKRKRLKSPVKAINLLPPLLRRRQLQPQIQRRFQENPANDLHKMIPATTEAGETATTIDVSTIRTETTIATTVAAVVAADKTATTTLVVGTFKNLTIETGIVDLAAPTMETMLDPWTTATPNKTWMQNSRTSTSVMKKRAG